MMVRDRAHTVTVAIVELITAARSKKLHDVAWMADVENLLRDEFAAERHQGVADRGDDNL
jgi:hypothetical protein